jgi:hypothetical protein
MWTESINAGGWTNVLLHKLLSWRPLEGGHLLSERVPEESLRVSSILYLAVIWGKFGVIPIRTGDLTAKLMFLRLQQTCGWQSFWPLEAWLIVIGAILGDELERQYFISEIIRLADRHEITAAEVVKRAKEILWIEDAFGRAIAALHEELLEK